MKTRQRPHEASHHFARRRIASRFAERLIVNRDNDHARWRGTGAGKKEAPVEGQVFNSVQRGSEAVNLLRAQSTADDHRCGQKGAGEEPGRPGRSVAIHSPKRERRALTRSSPHVLATTDVSVGVMSTPCPSVRTTN